LSVPLSQLPLEVKIKLVQLVTKQKAQYAKITAQNLIQFIPFPFFIVSNNFLIIQ